MKNLKLLFGIITLTMISFQTYAQEYELDEKAVTGIFEIEGKNKSELFSTINKWISINYNSAQSVIQMNDKEAGTIIIKGINSAAYKNNLKIFYPKNKNIKEYVPIKFNHLIEINIKDNRFRIIYRITDIAVSDLGIFTDSFFNCISFNGNNENAIKEHIEFTDSKYKGVIGKKKRENIKSQTKIIFDELNNSIISDIKTTMKSIEDSIKSEKNDGW